MRLPAFDAVVLAGGRARRMGGTDKATLDLHGRTLLQWVAGALSDASRLVVVGPARPEVLRALFVREDPPGGGPIPALRAGLAAVEASWVAVLAADLPFLRGRHIALLRENAIRAAGAVLIDDHGREQWLASVWRAEPLRAALDRYHGDSVHGVLRPLGPARVSLTVPHRTPPPWFDCDTPEDIETAREWA